MAIGTCKRPTSFVLRHVSPSSPATMSTDIPHTPLIIIGAGFSGLATAIQLKRLQSITSFEIYEKADSVGGTWWHNTYPGCGVDIPSHFYSWSWSLNANWSHPFVDQKEILQYIQEEAKRWSLLEKIHFRVECLGAEWNDDTCLWTVQLRNCITGEEFVRKCRILVSAVGVFSVPKTLEVPGVESFQGQIFHSSKWRHDISLQGKNIVVIGNGCSATQFVPIIAQEAKTITQFIRSQHYVHERPNKPHSTGFKWVMRNVPGIARAYRWIIAGYLDFLFTAFYTKEGASQRRVIEKETIAYMKRTTPEKYHSILIPTHHLGQKRRVFDTDYLDCLNRENVYLTNDPISHLTPASVVTSSGAEYPADVVILANGFHTQSFILPMRFVNATRGISLDSSPETGVWRETGPEAYLGCCVPGFPNLFLLVGPNTITGHYSVIYTSECAVNFTIRIARLVLTHHADSVELKKAVLKRESEWIQKQFQRLVWTKEEGGWYVDRETGRNHLIYPSFQTHYWLRTIIPKFSNFEIRGAKNWFGFYVGLLRGKLWRNRWWVLAIIVAALSWYVKGLDLRMSDLSKALGKLPKIRK